MPADSPRPSSPQSPPRRSAVARLRLFRARVRRARHAVSRRLILFSAWVWIAAISLVGVEMLDVVFGTFVLAPEFLPVVLLAFAVVWWFRERLGTGGRAAGRVVRSKALALRSRLCGEHDARATARHGRGR